jgi:hypothetical protein
MAPTNLRNGAAVCVSTSLCMSLINTRLLPVDADRVGRSIGVWLARLLMLALLIWIVDRLLQQSPQSFGSGPSGGVPSSGSRARVQYQ